MENKKILILEGDNYTIKSITELAEKEDLKVVIVGAGTDLALHSSLIEKFAVTGYVLLATTQLIASDKQRVEDLHKKREELYKPNGSLTEMLIEQSQKLKFELTRLPELEPIIIHDCDQRRKVEHPQAKPVRQFIPAQKNHHFRRK